MEAAVRRLAAKIDAPDRPLPTFDHIVGDAMPFIEQRGDGFHFVVSERGTEQERVVSAAVPSARHVLVLAEVRPSRYRACRRAVAPMPRRARFLPQNAVSSRCA